MSQNLTIISLLPLTEKNHGKLVLRTLGGMAELGHDVIVLDGGDHSLDKVAFDYTQAHGKKFQFLETNDTNLKKALKKANMIVYPVSPPREVLKKTCTEGIVPVLPKGIKGFDDYSVVDETGNAFTFETPDFWPFISAVIRGVENSKFEYDWSRIKKNTKKIAEEL